MADALINRMDGKRKALMEIGIEFEKRVKGLGYKCMGVHYRGTDTKDVMLVSLIVADQGFDAKRPDGMDWAHELKAYHGNHFFPWEDGEGSLDSEMEQD